MTASPQQNQRALHLAHPEYGFGVVRYVEEDAFGDVRLQISFDHRDGLETVAPDQVELLPDPIADAVVGKFGSASAFRRKLAAGLVISENNHTGTFTKSAVQPLPHQAFLLDKILATERFGHILADDVGLGKTIEAGLLITCMLRRDPPQRIMIVCPTGLSLQWQDEMEEHFGLNFSIMGENFDGKLPSSWRTQLLVIAPLDRLKRDGYREILAQVGPFDLVICDEAHRLTAQRRFLTQTLEKTANYQLFEFLLKNWLIRSVKNNDQTPRSPRLLLLSGTPHQGDDERFLHLLHLVRPDLYDLGRRPSEQLNTKALIETLTRTPKSQAVDWDGKPLFKGHVTATLDVHWTTEEAEVSRLLSDYILKSLDFVRDSDRGTQLVIQLVMHTFHKLAASSWTAIERALQRRLASLEGRVQRLDELLGDDADDDTGNGKSDFVLPAREFFDRERSLLLTLLGRLSNLVADSKWERCAELLKEIERTEPGAKVLVFTQYRVTQDTVRTRLITLFPGAQVELVHGEVEAADRRTARIRFENASRFLVSTEAGGEGVNLQKACHVMVNYDLPWNPMRLQQRVGRLDRYGQQHVVQVFNLRVPDSWDQHISTRILERLDVIQHTMGLAGAGAVENYREMILGEIAEQLDVPRLFRESRTGGPVDDKTVDEWVRGAVQSIERWSSLFNPELGLGENTPRLKPTLTSDDLKTAFKLACDAEGMQLRETRNSQNQFVPGVYHFELPTAFRDPVFRPSRTLHVAFDRGVYAAVRGQDLGVVRGQPIRPILGGFGEPFTDWVFQTAMNARPSESTFSLHADAKWPHGSGWLLVYALRWKGRTRRISAPDSLVIVFSRTDAAPIVVSAREATTLLDFESSQSSFSETLTPEREKVARACAQDVLRESVAGHDANARRTAGLSLLMVAQLHTGTQGPVGAT